MIETKTNEKSLIYTKHGRKKLQGVLAIVNGKTALTYMEGKGKQITGYTTLEELMVQASTQTLPQYQLEF